MAGGSRLVLVLLLASPARAELSVEGECPSAAMVARALEELHPDQSAAIAVRDLGDHYEVQAAGSTRSLDDARRRCSERATAAALAIALLLDPPTVPSAVEEPPDEPLPRPPPLAKQEKPLELRRAPPRPPRKPSRIELELSGMVDGAPQLSRGVSLVTGGAALRFAVGGRNVAALIGVSGLAPSTATASGVDVEVVRVPFDLGLRLALPLGRVELGGDVGLVLAILRLKAPSLLQSDTSTRLDAGARAAAGLRIWLSSRIALQLTAQLTASFQPYDLTVKPSEVIATTPYLWVGGAAGLAARF